METLAEENEELVDENMESRQRTQSFADAPSKLYDTPNRGHSDSVDGSLNGLEQPLQRLSISTDLREPPSPSRQTYSYAFRRFERQMTPQGRNPVTPDNKAQVEDLVVNVISKELKLPELGSGRIDEKKSAETTNGVVDVPLDGNDQEPSTDTAVESSSNSRISDTITNSPPRKMTPFGGRGSSDESIRRDVLTTIMVRGMRGKDVIAQNAAPAAQKLVQDMDRKRAVELMANGEANGVIPEEGEDDEDSSGEEGYIPALRPSLASLKLSSSKDSTAKSATTSKSTSREEDEAMEALRLLLIQNRVAQGSLTPESAAKVLAPPKRTGILPANGMENLDEDDESPIEAGEIDPRLAGCGNLSHAVFSALKLWKSSVVTSAELLELVQKDLQFVRQSALLEANATKLLEDSAFWVRFAFGERWAEKKARLAACSVYGSDPRWDLVGIIVKSNDDLRQEAFIMQLIEMCNEAFQLAGLELWLHPYKILATGRTTGIIEMVHNALSFDSLKKREGYGGLRGHMIKMTEYAADPKSALKEAKRNFVRSLAAYSLMSYLFLFKDRHNGNLLLDTAGHVIHIDFGFVFGIAPGGSFSLEMSTPFKLTEEMIEVMDGMNSPLFSEFVTLFCCGFLALQAHMDTFITVVEITCNHCTFKCFEGKDPIEVVSKLRERFCPQLKKEATVAFAMELIKQSANSYGTAQYDYFQYLSQGIAT